MRTAACALAVALTAAAPAHAFCGFFVGKADGQLFNKSSQVAIVRDGNRTVITMGNDFKGEMDEFALVVPVPSVLTREQIHVGERRLLERLDAYSAPRLVEYTDGDPCALRRYPVPMAAARPSAKMHDLAAVGANVLGVTVEAAYTVGEYDIVLLSATQSQGLEIWLRESGYRIPARAAAALASYVRQQMKFFVARVNVKEQRKTGYQELRSIQIAFESPKFMLPIRLGMAIATEYVWNMGFCDPCAAPPLSTDELRQLGVFWVPDDISRTAPGGVPVTLTRLHLRYDAEHFPEDLMFQETGDQQSFQGRYVIRHPWRGNASCAAASAYREQLGERRRNEAETLASLTGWEMSRIHQRMGEDAPGQEQTPWWRKLWP